MVIVSPLGRSVRNNIFSACSTPATRESAVGNPLRENTFVFTVGGVKRTVVER